MKRSLLIAVLVLFLFAIIDFLNSDAFVRVSVVHSRALDVVADIVGWLYFVAWSVSFYPQIYENYKRKRYRTIFPQY